MLNFERMDELCNGDVVNGVMKINHSDNMIVTIFNQENNTAYADLNALLVDYIKFAVDKKDNRHLENALLLINPKRLSPELFTLCQALLLQSWHSWQEDLVQILEDNANHNALPTLYEAFKVRSPHQDYNNNYALHKKIMWAIYKIEGKACREKLLKMEKFVSPKLRIEFKQFLGEMKSKKL